jgi:heme exporter protein D
VGTYDNYLLFGIGGVWGNIKRTLFAYPLAHIVCLFGMFAAVPIITRRRLDPSAMVFLLMPVFYGYWWLFFAPGQLARYRWLSYVLAAVLVAVCLVNLVRWARSADLSVRRRMAVGSVILLAVIPYVHWTWGQAGEVYTNREMLEE